MSLLEASGMRKSFGGLTALNGAEIAVEQGEILGLIGPNGAGKTTLFNCMSGTLTPDAGTVRFGGEDVTGLKTHRLARRGLVRTYQQTRELTTMTVRENVLLAAPDHPGERTIPAITESESARAREREAAAQAADLIEFFDLDHLAEEYAGNLSGGQRKLLEFARALMLDPDLLMLDEPLAGVNPTLAATIIEYIHRLNDDGMSFLIIEHEIERLVDMVDRLVVLSNGTVLAEGDPEAVVNREDVIEAYLGGELE